MEIMNKQRLMTAPAFAKAIGVTPQTLKNWAKKGLLCPAFHFPNGRPAYRAEQVERYFAGEYDPSRREQGEPHD